MNVKTVLMMLCICVAGLFISSDGFAAIYKYADKDGMIYFANDLQSVPVQYRSTARIISGEAKAEEMSSETQRQQTHPQESEKKEPASAIVQKKSFFETTDTGSFGNRVLISVILVVSALFAFYILKVLDADHKKPIAIARVVIIWGLSVFLIYNHARDVVSAFAEATDKLESAQRESGEKGKKAAKAIKALDALVEKAEKMSSSDPGGAGPEK